jgi:hypothetical protein
MAERFYIVRRAGAGEPLSIESETVRRVELPEDGITTEQLLATEGGPEALEAWRRDDDSAWTAYTALVEETFAQVDRDTALLHEIV